MFSGSKHFPDKNLHLLTNLQTERFLFLGVPSGGGQTREIAPMRTQEKPNTNMNRLYERLGGAEAVDAAVDLFYNKVLADDRIKHFFDGVDMKSQAGHQKAFLTSAFGGSPNYSGKNMRDGHKHFVEKWA